MKKIIGILAISFIFVSCSNNENIIPDAECNCGIITESRQADIVTIDGLQHISVIKIENICTGAIKEKSIGGNWYVGYKICNY